MSENIDGSLTTSILRDIRDELRTNSVLLSRMTEVLSAHSRRFDDIDRHFDKVEGRMSDNVRELEMVVKGDMLGARTNFEVQWENKLHDLNERLKALEERTLS
jgi:succinylglutamate desuccinylase